MIKTISYGLGTAVIQCDIGWLENSEATCTNTSLLWVIFPFFHRKEPDEAIKTVEVVLKDSEDATAALVHHYHVSNNVENAELVLNKREAANVAKSLPLS